MFLYSYRGTIAMLYWGGRVVRALGLRSAPLTATSSLRTACSELSFKSSQLSQPGWCKRHVDQNSATVHVLLW